jgi:hypothetical protein
VLEMARDLLAELERGALYQVPRSRGAWPHHPRARPPRPLICRYFFRKLAPFVYW